MTYSATHTSGTKLSGLPASWDGIKAATDAAGYYWKHAKEILGSAKYLASVPAAVSATTKSGWTVSKEAAA